MFPKYKTTGLLLTFVFCIYFLRNHQVSPGSLLKNRIGRFLQDQQLQERFCTDVPPTSQYTESQQETAEGYRNSLDKVRSDDKTLTALINNNEPNDQFIETYLKSLIPILVPWACFFVVGVLMFIVFFINFCCMNCRCCRSCACRCCLPPKTGRMKSCLATFSLICLVLAAGASVAGIIFSVKVPQQANSSICWTIRLLDKINEGSMEENWIGLNPGIDKMDLVVGNINKAASGTSVFGAIVNNASNKIDQASNLVGLMYEDNKDIVIDRIDPEGGTYEPDYIQKLGPLADTNSITGAIQVEFNFKKQGVSGIGDIVDELTLTVKQNADDIINEIQDSRPTIVQVSDDISQIENDIAQHQNTIKTVINAVGGVLLGLFIANLSLAALAFIGIILVCCGAKAFNKAIHISWCTIGLLMLVGWVVSTVIFALTIFTSESCDVGTKSIDDPVFFNKTFDKLGSVLDLNDADFNRTRGVLYTCMHGDGDLAREFNLRENIPIFDQIYSTINQNSELAVQALGLISTSVVIPSTRSLLTQVSEGTTPDSQNTINDLIKLNGYTRASTNPCTNVKDTWVINSGTCEASLGTEFSSSSSNTFNLNNPTCIGFNVWKAGDDNIVGRYTSTAFPQPTCGDVNGENMHLYLQSYINSLANNREQTQTVINRILEDLNNVNQANGQFATELNKIPNSIQDLNTTVASIQNLLTASDGLIANSNCKFVRNDVETLLDVTCTGIGATLYKITLTYLILAFVTFVGTFMLFCLAKRFTLPTSVEKQVEIYKQVEIKSYPINQSSQYPLTR